MVFDLANGLSSGVFYVGRLTDDAGFPWQNSGGKLKLSRRVGDIGFPSQSSDKCASRKSAKNVKFFTMKCSLEVIFAILFHVN